MKKFLILFILFITGTLVSSAQDVMKFNTISFTYQELTPYGWSGWAPYQSSNVMILMDFNRDIVTIYSPVTQKYKIIDYYGTTTDSDGDTTAKFQFIDQDGDYGTMRLMQRRTGKSEIYIQYQNVIWTYSVIRIL